MMFKKTYLTRIVVITLLIGKIILHYFLINPQYELHRDEFLHLDQANHLAWGYVSVPPFTSWISFLIKELGNGVFWVHFFPALFGALTIYVAVKIVTELGGGDYAKILITLVLLFSALLRINMLFQPNTIDILAWTLVFLFVIRFIKSKKELNLFYLALVLAFGFLNKYNIVFLLAGILISLPFTKQRDLFTKKNFYVAMVCAFILVLPNLYWQYSNNWPVISHMSELADSQLVNVKRGDFLKDQMLFFFNSSYLLLLALVSFFIYKPFKPYRLVILSFLSVIIIFIGLRAKSYYAIGLYPSILAFGCVYLERLLDSGWKRMLRPLFPVLIVLLFIPFLSIAFPIKSPDEIAVEGESFRKFGLLRWEDGKDHTLPQDFADMLGWKEMTKKAEAALLRIPAHERKHALIVTGNYGQAAAINYYSDRRVPDAVSFSTDYVNWFPPIEHIKHFIVVGEHPDIEDINHFKAFVIMDSITSKYARERGTKIFLLSYPDQIIIQKLKRRLVNKE